MGKRNHVPEGFDDGTPWGDMWEQLLASWLKLVEAYEQPKASDEGVGLGYWYDLSYWYGERSLTGLLGAAAWKIDGGWSLEEAGVARIGKKGKKKCGRVDLWFGRKDDASSVEAKICWIDHQDVQKAFDEIHQELKKAKKQLRKCKSDCEASHSIDRVGHPVSVCYVVPWFKGEHSSENGVQVLTAIQDLAWKAGWATAMHVARVRTKDELQQESRNAGTKTVVRAASNSNIEEDRRTYPGVLLVARRRKWDKVHQG